MLLETNEDAVKCRAHLIMENHSKWFGLSSRAFCQRLILTIHQFHDGPVSNRLNLSLGAMVLKDVDNFNEKLERVSVH